ncbi:MAG: TetR/AcrR family transcriptional regulator [Phycisphaeraceae bacterium]
MRRTRSHTADVRLEQQWRQADFDRRREMIIDVALRLLHQRGRKAVAMRRVAARLGVGTMTLYTYVDSQRTLHREMVRRGFDMLNQRGRASSTLGTPAGWRGGARAYLDFALEHPNLYKLMFDTPLPEDDLDMLQGGFQTLLDRVREVRSQQGEPASETEINRAAGRFWIALHGLASLAIAGRLSVLEGDLDDLLDDLLVRIAPA